MPDWKEVTKEINNLAENTSNPLDAVRRKYLNTFSKYTDRNVIAYYSAFVQKPSINGTEINDNDMNAFMQTIHGLDKSKGLDLILHTPGGNLASAVSIVTYLKSIFHNNIRAFVPQMAMSAGTMISLSCKEIILGKQSALGPIDPQYGGLSASGVVEQYHRAVNDINSDSSCIPLWQVMYSKYNPVFIGDCEKAVKWANEQTYRWLCENMFDGDNEAHLKARKIVEALSDHSKTYFHGRQYHIDELKDIGIKVKALEELDKDNKIDGCADLQDCLLTVHHSYMQSFANSNAIKIIENQNGNAMIIQTAKE